MRKIVVRKGGKPNGKVAKPINTKSKKTVSTEYAWPARPRASGARVAMLKRAKLQMEVGVSKAMNERDRWDPKTGFYSGQFMATGIPTVEDRMNWLALHQSREREGLRELDRRNSREFVLAERRVVGCSHVWKPVHKWLHKEYMHCIRCGAVKHQDGTIWFFVGHHAIKLGA
jgi:hypothetical protein